MTGATGGAADAVEPAEAAGGGAVRPVARGRVEAWATLYRKPAATDGRGWITLDGVQIHSMSDMPGDAAWKALGEATDAAAEAEPGTAESDWTRRGENFFTHAHFHADLEDYVQTTVEDLLTSECPLRRALAMLDRRLGKRRLRLADIETEHPLVQTLHRIRAEAEGW